MAMALFHPYTATGKLKAVMTPTTPRGFQFSIKTWPGRSEGSTDPPTIRDNPTAKSQMSTYSWTSPMPSGLILPEEVMNGTYVCRSRQEIQETSYILFHSTVKACTVCWASNCWGLCLQFLSLWACDDWRYLSPAHKVFGPLVYLSQIPFCPPSHTEGWVAG